MIKIPTFWDETCRSTRREKFIGIWNMRTLTKYNKRFNQQRYREFTLERIFLLIFEHRFDISFGSWLLFYYIFVWKLLGILFNELFLRFIILTIFFHSTTNNIVSRKYFVQISFKLFHLKSLHPIWKMPETRQAPAVEAGSIYEIITMLPEKIVIKFFSILSLQLAQKHFVRLRTIKLFF